VDFTSEIVTRAFRITNNGNVTLIIPAAGLSGDTADFEVLGLSGGLIPVPVGGTFDFSVRFNPTSIGQKTAVVSIINSDPDENPYNFTVTGEGVNTAVAPDLEIRGGTGFVQSIPSGSTVPVVLNGTDLGTTAQGGSAVTATFRALGSGGASLTGISATSSHPDVTVSGLVSTLASGSFDNFTVSFAPNTAGVQTAQISIASSDPNENPYTFNVRLTVTSTAVPPAEITNLTRGGSNAILTLIGTAGETYRIQTSTTLDPTWSNVSGHTSISATGSAQSRTLIGLGNSPVRHFRVVRN
jgi:hypothetical protein